jgi:glycosyltransferase involved in cell wall biosynthesis
MKIGIDISQLAYERTGVATYVRELVASLVRLDTQNEYVLFFSSLRGKLMPFDFAQGENVTIKQFKFPPSLLDILWNKLHIMPIESLIGDVDVFITSDWTEPPVRKAKKITILYDLIVYKFPEETDSKIIATQKRKLAWVKKESDRILCISEGTKKDAMEILGIEENRLAVVYPGV